MQSAFQESQRRQATKRRAQPSELPSAERARELFDYDAAMGVLRCRVRGGNRSKAIGAIAGNRNALGRRVVSIDGVQYLAYRVIWLYVTGAWPAHEIDHIDGDCTNDRFENLRDVEGRVNHENQRRGRIDNRSGKGLLGAYESTGGRWRAQIVVAGKAKHLGCFATEDEAHEAYVKAKRRLHVGCTI